MNSQTKKTQNQTQEESKYGFYENEVNQYKANEDLRMLTFLNKRKFMKLQHKANLNKIQEIYRRAHQSLEVS